jgi:hypothetical protein
MTFCWFSITFTDFLGKLIPVVDVKIIGAKKSPPLLVQTLLVLEDGRTLCRGEGAFIAL